MYIEKETEKAYLMCHDAVLFWIKKRWFKNNKPTPEFWKAFHVAKREHCQHIGFDVLKEFKTIHKTDKAVLLGYTIIRASGIETEGQFWMPLSMTGNYNFVAKKIKQIENDFPFIDAHVVWSEHKQAQDEKECA